MVINQLQGSATETHWPASKGTAAFTGPLPAVATEHFADVLREMKCKRCKSDPNLYERESAELYTLAYVDNLMIIGSKEMREAFIKNCLTKCF